MKQVKLDMEQVKLSEGQVKLYMEQVKFDLPDLITLIIFPLYFLSITAPSLKNSLQNRLHRHKKPEQTKQIIMKLKS